MKVYFEKGLTVINTGDPVGGCKNKHGHSGISYRSDYQTYQAKLQYKGKVYSLGEFKAVEDAIAYHEEAKQQVANGNFLEWFETLYGKTKRNRRKR